MLLRWQAALMCSLCRLFDMVTLSLLLRRLAGRSRIHYYVHYTLSMSQGLKLWTVTHCCCSDHLKQVSNFLIIIKTTILILIGLNSLLSVSVVRLWEACLHVESFFSWPSPFLLDFFISLQRFRSRSISIFVNAD